MVGNDVVDLRDRDSDIASYRERFDARVFSRREREMIARSPTGETLRWCLWAAKEASYKLARQLDPDTVFSPAAFEVALESSEGEMRGTVSHPGGRVHVAIDVDPQRIHALAVREEEEFQAVFCSVVERHPADDQSAAVRKLARASLAARLGCEDQELEIRSAARIPGVFRGDARLDMGLSLSHHGRFVAFACSEGSSPHG